MSKATILANLIKSGQLKYGDLSPEDKTAYDRLAETVGLPYTKSPASQSTQGFSVGGQSYNVATKLPSTLQESGFKTPSLSSALKPVTVPAVPSIRSGYEPQDIRASVPRAPSVKGGFEPVGTAPVRPMAPVYDEHGKVNPKTVTLYQPPHEGGNLTLQQTPGPASVKTPVTSLKDDTTIQQVLSPVQAAREIKAGATAPLTQNPRFVLQGSDKMTPQEKAEYVNLWENQSPAHAHKFYLKLFPTLSTRQVAPAGFVGQNVRAADQGLQQGLASGQELVDNFTGADVDPMTRDSRRAVIDSGDTTGQLVGENNAQSGVTGQVVGGAIQAGYQMIPTIAVGAVASAIAPELAAAGLTVGGAALVTRMGSAVAAMKKSLPWMKSAPAWAKGLSKGSKAARIAGSATFAHQAFGSYAHQSELDQMAEYGYVDTDKQMAAALLNASAEVLMENVLFFPRILRTADDGVRKQFTKNLAGNYKKIGGELLKGYLGEATEEALMEPLNNVVANALYGSDRQVFVAEDMLMSGAIGGLMGLSLSAGPTAFDVAAVRRISEDQAQFQNVILPRILDGAPKDSLSFEIADYLMRSGKDITVEQRFKLAELADYESSMPADTSKDAVLKTVEALLEDDSLAPEARKELKASYETLLSEADVKAPEGKPAYRIIEKPDGGHMVQFETELEKGEFERIKRALGGSYSGKAGAINVGPSGKANPIARIEAAVGYQNDGRVSVATTDEAKATKEQWVQELRQPKTQTRVDIDTPAPLRVRTGGVLEVLQPHQRAAYDEVVKLGLDKEITTMLAQGQSHFEIVKQLKKQLPKQKAIELIGAYEEALRELAAAELEQSAAKTRVLMGYGAVADVSEGGTHVTFTDDKGIRRTVPKEVYDRLGWAQDVKDETLDRIEKGGGTVITSLDQFQKDIRGLMAELGTEVVFYNNPDSDTNGHYSGNNTLYVNTAKTQNEGFGRFVVFHEFLHFLEVADAELYNQLVDLYQEKIGPEAVAAYRENILKGSTHYQDDRLVVMEMLSDEFGNMASKEEFWLALRNENKGLFESMFSKLKAFFAKMRQLFGGDAARFETYIPESLLNEMENEFKVLVARARQRHLAGETVEGGLGEVRNKFAGEHTTPHTFDRFDHSKMGTGEGAQVYGWGTYLSTSDEVRDFYRKAFSQQFMDPAVRVTIKGRTLELSGGRMLPKQDGFSEAEIWAARTLRSFEGNLKEALAANEAALQRNFEEPYPSNAILTHRAELEETLKVLESLGEKDIEFIEPKPHTLKVEVDAEIEHLLNWDYDLKHQSPEVREILMQLSADLVDFEEGISYKGTAVRIEPEIGSDGEEYDPEPEDLNVLKGMSEEHPDYDMLYALGELMAENYDNERTIGAVNQWLYTRIYERTGRIPNYWAGVKASYESGVLSDKELPYDQNGSVLYERLTKKLGSDKEASLYLNGLGIPGIKYRDGASRWKKGEGSYNYVIFDESKMAITDRYSLRNPVEHTTPHVFRQFDHSKMGTGEGAQVYGWGTYLSSSDEVRDFYRKNRFGDTISYKGEPLTGRDGYLELDGKDLAPAVEEVVQDFYAAMKLGKFKGDPVGAKQSIKEDYEETLKAPEIDPAPTEAKREQVREELEELHTKWGRLVELHKTADTDPEGTWAALTEDVPSHFFGPYDPATNVRDAIDEAIDAFRRYVGEMNTKFDDLEDDLFVLRRQARRRQAAEDGLATLTRIWDDLQGVQTLKVDVDAEDEHLLDWDSAEQSEHVTKALFKAGVLRSLGLVINGKPVTGNSYNAPRYELDAFGDDLDPRHDAIEKLFAVHAANLDASPSELKALTRQQIEEDIEEHTQADYARGAEWSRQALAALATLDVSPMDWDGSEAYKRKTESGRSIYKRLEEKLGSDKEASLYLDSIGIPGLQYWDGNSRTKKDGTRNYVIFDDGKLNIVERYSVRGDLVALHNISETKLLKSLELGGMPVPSIAITKVDVPFESFGEITLVGDRDLIDPANSQNKVFDTDVYSRRVPREIYKVNTGALSKIMQTLKDAFDAVEESIYSVTVDEYHNNGLDDLLSTANNRKGMKYHYLTKVLGQTVKIPMRDRARAILEDKAGAMAFAKANPDIVEADIYSLTDDQKRRVGELLLKDIPATLKESTAQLLRDKRVGPDGMPSFSALDKAMTDLHHLGERVVDQTALRDLLDKKVKAKDFEAWVRETFAPVYGEKYFYDGNRKRPYSLDELFAFMSGRVKATEGFDYGPGNAKAKGAKKFNSIDQMHKSKHTIVTEEEVNDFKRSYEPLAAEMAAALVPLYQYEDSWGAMQEMYNAMGDYLAGKDAMGSLLRAGFKPTPEALEAFKKAADALQNAPVQYFEAKPQRVVQFKEFKAAIVHKRVAKSTVDALKEAGVERILRYNDSAERQAALDRIAPKVRFSERDFLDSEETKFLGACDRFRMTPEGEAAWQEMMDSRVEITPSAFAEAVDVSEALDEDETWEDYQADATRQGDPVKCYKSKNGLYFFQTAGFEFIWRAGPLQVDPSGNVRYSARTWEMDPKAKLLLRKQLTDGGFAGADVDKWFKNMDSLSAKILGDWSQYLDYIGDPDGDYIKPNGDPNYTWSVDASTLCRKRLQVMATVEAIQKVRGNFLTPEEMADVHMWIKNYAAEHPDEGIEVACALCYVESVRIKNLNAAKRFIDTYPADVLDYHEGMKKRFPKRTVPTRAALMKVDPKLILTAEGTAKLKKEHPEVYEALPSKVFVQQKAALPRTAFKTGELMGRIKPKDVAFFNERSGLRWQSWSDFEVLHLFDGMQVILEQAALGLKSHAYTKVPDFARAYGKTGMMINLSLIAKGSGLDAKGRLLFDPVEGMPIETAEELRNTFPGTVGTILVGISPEHIRAAMKDPRIDYVIPYHASALPGVVKEKFGIKEWHDYQRAQNEIIADEGLWKAFAEKHGLKSPKEITLKLWWNPEQDGDTNAKNYLALCDAAGLTPKFGHIKDPVTEKHYSFTEDPGYWKLLIDRKMFDNDGNYIDQQPAQPLYDDAFVEGLMADYRGTKDKPVAAAVEHFTRNSIGHHAGDLGKAEGLTRMTSGRGTGHFGTGTYFVGDKAKIDLGGYKERPQHEVELEGYKLFKPRYDSEARNLHDVLKFVNDYWEDTDLLTHLTDYKELFQLYHAVDYAEHADVEGILRKSPLIDADYIAEMKEKAEAREPEYATEWFADMAREDLHKAHKGDKYNGGLKRLAKMKDKLSDVRMNLDVLYGHEAVTDRGINAGLLDRFLKDLAEIRDEIHAEVGEKWFFNEKAHGKDSASTRLMKRLGWEGVDVRHLKAFDNTEFGTVVYDLNQERKSTRSADSFPNKTLTKGIDPSEDPDGIVQSILDMGLDHEVYTDEQALKDAHRWIDTVGVETALNDFILKPEVENLTKMHMVAAQIILKQAIAAGGKANAERAVRIVKAVSEKAKTKGQAIQALAMWSKLSPEGILLRADQIISGARTEAENKEVAAKTEEVRKAMEVINVQAVGGLGLGLGDLLKKLSAMTEQDITIERLKLALRNPQKVSAKAEAKSAFQQDGILKVGAKIKLPGGKQGKVLAYDPDTRRYQLEVDGKKGWTAPLATTKLSKRGAEAEISFEFDANALELEVFAEEWKALPPEKAPKEKVPKEKAPKEEPVPPTPEERAARLMAERVKRMTKEPELKMVDPVRVLVNTLFSVAKNKLPELSSEHQTPESLIADAILRRDEYRQVWEAAKAIVEDELSPEGLELVEDYLAVALQDNHTIAGNVKKAISRNLTEMETSVRSVIRDFYGPENLTRDLVSTLVEKSGLTGAEAEILASEVQRQMNDKTKEEKARALERIFAQAQKRPAKLGAREIAEIVNLGALESWLYKHDLPRVLAPKIKKAIADTGVDLSEIVRKAQDDQKSALSEITGAILTEIGGYRELSKSELVTLSRFIKDAVADAMDKKRKTRLAQMFPGKRRDGRTQRFIADRIIETTNLGGFDAADLTEAVADRLGLENVSDGLRQSLKDQANAIQKMPDGYERNLAVATMLDTIAKEIPPSAWEKINTFRTMAMLLNPVTIIRNVVGNSLFGSIDLGLVTRLASLLDGQHNLSNAQTRAAAKAGVAEGKRRAAIETELGVHVDNINRYDLPKARTFRGGVLGKANETLDRVLRGVDMQFYYKHYFASLSEQMQLANVTEPTQEMTDNAHALALYRTFQDDTALASAFSALRNALNVRPAGDGKGSGIQKYTGGDFGLGSLLLPFVKTPANLAMRALDYSPAGFVLTVARLHFDTTSSPYMRAKLKAMGISRALVGTGIVGIGYALAALGIITGGGDDDEKEFISDMGIGKYRVNATAVARLLSGGYSGPDVQPGDVTVRYDWLQPVSVSLAMGADIHDRFVAAPEGTNPFLELLVLADSTWQSTTSVLTEQSMVSSLSRFFTGGDLQKGLTRLLAGAVASFVPSAATRFGNAFDSTVRDTEADSVVLTGVKKAVAKIPGAAWFLPEFLPAEVNELGLERKYYDPARDGAVTTFAQRVSQLVSPAIWDKYQPSEAEALIAEVYQKSKDKSVVPDKLYDKARSYKDDNGETIGISAAEYQRVFRTVGPELDRELRQAVADGIREKTLDEQVEWIKRILARQDTRVKRELKTE